MMKSHDLMIVLFFTLLTVVGLAIVVAGICRATLPPMQGYIDGKTYHPAYFPADQNTPWVYCLGITSMDGNQACAWKVSKEVYDSYNIGDLTGKPSNVQKGDAY